MTRFARQPYKYSCGPTAIINATKWAGYLCSIKEHHTLISRLCESSYEFGTDEAKFEEVLRRFISPEVSIRKRNRPSLRDVIQHLNRPDCAVVLLYWRGGKDYGRNPRSITGHYVLLVSDNKGVLCINDEVNVTVMPLGPRELMKKLGFNDSDRETYPQAWLLRKR